MARQFKVIIDAPSIPYLSSDLYGGFVQVDYTFGASGTVHLAEGDRILETALGTSSFDPVTGPNTLTLSTESNHTTWEITADAVRYHNNIIDGFIPYAHLCSSDPTVFDDYSIEMKTVGEELLTFVHSGQTGRPSFTIVSKYTKRTLFGTANFYSPADKIHDNPASDTKDVYYDKRVVYGSPGWQVLKKGIRNKAIGYWVNGTNPYGAQDGSGTILNSYLGYIREEGRITIGTSPMGSSLTASKTLYKIASVDMSIEVDDFVTAEHDVHGRAGSYLEFTNHTNPLGRHINFKTSISGGHNAYNIPYSPTQADDITTAPSGSTTWPVNSYFHVLALADYDYYRTGFHSEASLSITLGAGVLGINPKIPFCFNRLISGISILTGDAKINENVTDLDIQEYVVKFRENFVGATWDYHTAFLSVAGALDSGGDGNCFLKTFAYDKKIFESTTLGGNHIQETGNPNYAKVTNTNNIKEAEILLSPNVFSDSVSYSKMVKDYSIAGISNLAINGRLYSAVVNFNEYQNGVLPTKIEQDFYDIRYTGYSANGSNYHHYNAAGHILPNRDIGKPVALTVVNMPQGLNQATQADRNALLVLAENGYRYINLSSGNPGSGPNTTYLGDCCVSKKSVISSNGIAYCAGRDGVYQFAGQQKVDITKLGGSDITETWRGISDTVKAGSIGIYDTKNKCYLLAVKETYVDPIALLNKSGYRIYVFDFEVEDIYSYFVETWGQDLLKFSYIDGILYVFTKGKDRSFFIGYYDNSTTNADDEGFTGLNDPPTSTSASIIRVAELNQQKLNDRDFLIKSILINYDLVSGTFIITLKSDNAELYDLTLSSGTDQIEDHRINRDYNARCKTFAFRVETLYDLLLKDVAVEVTDPLQRKWIKHAES